MEKLLIKKNVAINARKEKVWEVLWTDKYLRQWCAEFMPGSYAKTDWQQGSKVTFLDEKKSGMVGRIIAKKPNELLTIEFDGMVTNGEEDLESEGAKAVQGGHESYYLTEKNGATTLSIKSDMTEEYYDMMSEVWDRALQKIKSLAESI